MSKRKYHFIIPVDDEWNKPLEEGAFDVQTHLLHGLIHCNGFGHLVCELKGVLSTFVVERLWISGIVSAQLFMPGKSQWRICPRSMRWISDCFMELLMGAPGLVDGDIDSIMGALG